jgi:ABC-2 type transport system ATP-binding protein
VVETERTIDGLAELSGVHDLRVDDHQARFDVDTARLGAALEHLTALGVRSLTSQPPTLEELFLRHYGDELAELEGAGLSGDGSSRPTESAR